ncbi:DUF1974 domain-containing protein [Motilimonas cestriensis]|uniref:DUF1974 domain-containing protein n=1 Tax=Motilimonas cestriensis TaxID=2742685 RepID=A0ABS8WBK2_9GAMM|nr:acyl-CoA dehydrogenase domain-containing protein [Motilimonas cestriensis]MCE2595482.1 DUF1974 domain-containing protein [Motilimonas cestriensis]
MLSFAIVLTSIFTLLCLIIGKASLASATLILGLFVLFTLYWQWLPVSVFIIYLVLAVLLNNHYLRQRYLSRPLQALFVRRKKNWLPPQLPHSEGWLERKIITGLIQWHHLHAQPAPRINAQEQAFLDGPTHQLCQLINSEPCQGGINEACWRYLNQRGFFALSQPYHLGGHAFSCYGINKIIQKVASVNSEIAETVALHNSLGSASFLQHCAPREAQSIWLRAICKGRKQALFSVEPATLVQQMTPLQGELTIDKHPIPSPVMPDLLILPVRLTAKGEEHYLLIETEHCKQLSFTCQNQLGSFSIAAYPFALSDLICPETVKPWYCRAQAWLKLNLSALQAAQMKQALISTHSTTDAPLTTPDTTKQPRSDRLVGLLLRVSSFDACIAMTCSATDNGENPILIADLLTNEIDHTRSRYVLPLSSQYFEYLYTCHPYLLTEYQSCQEPDQLEHFDQQVISHLGFTLNQLLIVFTHKLFARYSYKACDQFYFRLIERYSHILAVLGEDLLFSSPHPVSRDKQQGRLLRLLSLIYVMTALLRSHQHTTIKYSALDKVINEIEALLQNIAGNMKGSLIGRLFCWLCLPSRPLYLPESDQNYQLISQEIAQQKINFQHLCGDINRAQPTSPSSD